MIVCHGRVGREREIKSTARRAVAHGARRSDNHAAFPDPRAVLSRVEACRDSVDMIPGSSQKSLGTGLTAGFSRSAAADPVKEKPR